MSGKDQKYLAKVLGNAVPVSEYIAPEVTVPQEQYEDVQAQAKQEAGIVNDLRDALNALNLGVTISRDAEGTLYIGKGTKSGNHYIIFQSLEDGGHYSYAFVNQDKENSNVIEYDTAQLAAEMFHEQVRGDE